MVLVNLSSLPLEVSHLVDDLDEPLKFCISESVSSPERDSWLAIAL